MALQFSDCKAHRVFWSAHIEAWMESGLSQRSFCDRHQLPRAKFSRWVNFLVGEETIRNHMEYRKELLRDERKIEHRKQGRKTQKYRYGARTDVNCRAVQAFWAMHVEALNWSGMGLHDYASALDLSPTSLRRWRDRFEDSEVGIDWRAHLHPSARPKIRPRPKEFSATNALTRSSDERPENPQRRRFSIEEKRAIVLETERDGVTVSSVARKHGITTSMLFRWRVDLGLSKDRQARLATIQITEEGEDDETLTGDALPNALLILSAGRSKALLRQAAKETPAP